MCVCVMKMTMKEVDAENTRKIPLSTVLAASAADLNIFPVKIDITRWVRGSSELVIYLAKKVVKVFQSASSFAVLKKNGVYNDAKH